MNVENHLQKQMEIRAEGADDEKIIEGYFVRFDDVYDMGGGWTESVDPHAFDDTLGQDIRALCDHDTRIVLGRTSNGTAEISVDEKGLFARIKINPDDADAVNTWARVKRGDVDQASFGFKIIEEEKTQDGDAIHWTLKKVELFEISVCTFPAYENTSLTARHNERENMERRKFEMWKAKQEERVSKWH